MDKECVKASLLALSTEELEHATENYQKFLAGSRLDPYEPIENDEEAQARFQASLAEAFDQPIHTAQQKIRAISEIDFGPKDAVGSGAVVCIDDRHFVIGVATGKFTCEGTEMIGLSQNAPFYSAIEGLKVGDETEFHNRDFVIKAIF